MILNELPLKNAANININSSHNLDENPNLKLFEKRIYYVNFVLRIAFYRKGVGKKHRWTKLFRFCESFGG